MKNKGFTLIELIACIGLMAMLATIIIPITVKKINEAKEKSRDFLITSIELAAQNYASKNLDLLTNLKQYDWENITLQTLVENKEISSNLLDQTTGKNLPLTDVVYVTKSYNGKINANYDINQNINDILTLNGSYNIYLDKNETYIEEGALAFTKEGEDISSIIERKVNVNFNRKGNYKITYQIDNKLIERNIIILEDNPIQAYSLLTIDLDNGTVDEEQSGTYEVGKILKLNIPQKNDYFLTEWEKISGNGVISGNLIIIGSEPTTIKAKYSPNIPLIVDIDGGEFVNALSENPSGSYASNTSIELNAVRKPGYTFNFWQKISGDGILRENSIVIRTEPTTIKAIFTPITYTIKYNCNGGTGNIISSIHTYGQSSLLNENKCLNFSTLPSSFIGWGLSSNSTEILYTDKANVMNLIPTGNEMTLYALYEPTVTITGNYTYINEGAGNWRIKILGSTGSTSGTATIKFDQETKLDVFLVSGGNNGTEAIYAGCCGGGAGGSGGARKMATKTVAAGTYNVVVGSAGQESTAFGLTSSGGTVSAGGIGAGVCGLLESANNSTPGKTGGLAFGTVAFDETYYGAGGGGGVCGNIYNVHCGEHGLSASGGGSTGGGSACGGSGIANTGGGGGGGCNDWGYTAPGTGGSGIVIIRNSRG